MQDYARGQSQVLKFLLCDYWDQSYHQAAARAPRPAPEDVPIPSVEHSVDLDDNPDAENLPPLTKSRPRKRAGKKAPRARRGRR